MAWQIEKAAGAFKGEANGPVWDGEAVLFALVGESRIMRYYPGTGRVMEHRKYTCGTRGLAFDNDGTLYGCQTVARRVARFNNDGSVSMLADRLDGLLHNSPYDLAFDALGRIWFTDSEKPARVMEPPVDHFSVLRLERDSNDTWSLRRLTADTHAPSGIAFAKGGEILYVADTHDGASARSELRAYPVKGDVLAPPAVLFSLPVACAIKGMCVDADGNIVLCLGGAGGNEPSVALLDSTGKIIARQSLGGSVPTNCAFGDDDGTSLYITTSDGYLYRTRGLR